MADFLDTEANYGPRLPMDRPCRSCTYRGVPVLERAIPKGRPGT